MKAEDIVIIAIAIVSVTLIAIFSDDKKQEIYWNSTRKYMDCVWNTMPFVALRNYAKTEYCQFRTTAIGSIVCSMSPELELLEFLVAFTAPVFFIATFYAVFLALVEILWFTFGFVTKLGSRDATLSSAVSPKI